MKKIDVKIAFDCEIADEYAESIEDARNLNELLRNLSRAVADTEATFGESVEYDLSLSLEATND